MLIVFWMIGACSCWFLGGRSVMSSFCRSCTTPPMLDIWVDVKCLKLCNRGSGGLKCSSMLSHLFGVVQFVNWLKTCRRHLLVCFNCFQYPMVSLSIGPLTLSQVFLKLMVARFVNGLKTCRRHLLVCFNRFQYPMVSLSIGPLSLSQVFLKLMVLMPC